MEKKFKIAALQIESLGTKEDILKRAESLVALAKEKDVKMVCLPELFLNLWFPEKITPKNSIDEVFEMAETIEGESIAKLKEIANRNKVSIIAPFFEKEPKDEGDEFYNSSVIISEEGTVIGTYRKTHLPQIPNFEEKSYFTPGKDLPVFETSIGKVGVLLGWDVFFPEAYRTLALKGAQIIFCPTASAIEASSIKWERVMMASAHQNGVFVVRVNRIGKEKNMNFYGKSFCVRPDGEFLMKPGGLTESLLVADINLDDMYAVRSDWVFLKDRNPKAYKKITEE